MHTAARPRLTSGIAALSASAIIATTVTMAPHHTNVPAFPELPGVTTSLELASLVNPFAAIGQVIQSTVTDVQQLVQNLSADPFPIAGVVVPDAVSSLGQLLKIGQSAISGIISGAQQYIPYSINNFIKYAKAGDWENALTYVLTPIAGIGIGLVTPMTDLSNLLAGPLETAANVVKAMPTLILQAALGVAILPVANMLQSVGKGIDALEAAVKSGNLGNVYNAVVNSAVNLTETMISNVVGPSGIIGSLLNLRTVIAQALNPAAAAAAAAAKTAAKALSPASATSVTLSTTATAAAAGATTPKPAATTESNTTATKTTDTSTTKTKAKRDHHKKDATDSNSNAGGATGGTSSPSDNSASSTSKPTSDTQGNKGAHGKASHKNSAGSASASTGKSSHAGHRGHSGSSHGSK
jgi:hypothetical protein